MKDEAAFWTAVRAAFTRRNAFLRKLPAEGFAGRGTPDGFFAFAGQTGVVELKYQKAWPKRPETTVEVGVTPDQWNWLEGVVTRGGRGFVVMGVGRDWQVLRLFELLQGESDPRFPIRMSQADLRGALFRGTTAADDIDRIPALVAQINPRA